VAFGERRGKPQRVGKWRGVKKPLGEKKTPSNLGEKKGVPSASRGGKKKRPGGKTPGPREKQPCGAAPLKGTTFGRGPGKKKTRRAPGFSKREGPSEQRGEGDTLSRKKKLTPPRGGGHRGLYAQKGGFGLQRRTPSTKKRITARGLL